MSSRILVLVLFSAVLSAADLAFTGTWVGAQPAVPAGSAVVLAMYDRNGTCCGGPAAALAGLGNLRTAMQDKQGMALIAVDVTADGTADAAKAAAELHHTAGLPLLLDTARATATALSVEISMTMTYVVRAADGTQTVVHSPNQVKKKLGL